MNKVGIVDWSQFQERRIYKEMKHPGLQLFAKAYS